LLIFSIAPEQHKSLRFPGHSQAGYAMTFSNWLEEGTRTGELLPGQLQNATINVVVNVPLVFGKIYEFNL
jgi:hypothetical protein